MRDFIYPTCVFILFLCVMAMLVVWTFKSGGASYSGGKRGIVTTVEKLQSEINKKIK